MIHNHSIKSSIRRHLLLTLLPLCLALHGCSKETPLFVKKDDFTLDPSGLKLSFIFVDELDLFVGRHEVSNAQFRRFRPDHSSGEYKGISLDKNSQPVVNVSWKEAQAFYQWLNQEYQIYEGKKCVFRLPTEAEWAAFASCGDDREYPWGQYWPPPSSWNYYGSENPGPGARLEANDGHKVSCPVEKSGANTLSIYGVGGNVWEWCEDAGGAEANTRILKGASWVDCHHLFLAINCSRMYDSKYRAVNMGFRVVARIVDAEPEEISAFESKKEQAELSRLAKEAEKQKAAEKLAAQRKQREDEAKQEAQSKARAQIIGLLGKMNYTLASHHLGLYEEKFGKDEFYAEVSEKIANTKVLNLSEDTFLELIRLPESSLWAGKYEVTNKQYRRFKPEHRPEAFRDRALDADEQPAVFVSWAEAKEFCSWLNERFKDSLENGLEYRLPAEREWESFASCGRRRDFPWGNDWPPRYGNFGQIEDYDDGFAVTCPVDESGENEWGLFGLAGNVWEWCEDSEKDSGRKILKGGAWNLNRPDALRLSNSISDEPDQKNIFIGFRIVIGPKLAEPK